MRKEFELWENEDLRRSSLGHWEDSCSSGFGPLRSGARPGDGHARPEVRLRRERRPRERPEDRSGQQPHRQDDPIAPDAGSHGVAFGAGGKLMFITNTGASPVSVIDTDNDEGVRTGRVATAPEGMRCKPP